MRAEVAQHIRSIVTSPDLEAAQARLKERVSFYTKGAPNRVARMEINLPQGFSVYALPGAHQRRTRTSNAIERLNQELKRRTRVARLVSNEPLLLRLVSARLCK
jgi:transposase-like protein